MKRLYLGVFLIAAGIVITVSSLTRSSYVQSGATVDLYNSLSSVYDALRWGIVGLLMTIIGGTLAVIGYVKKNIQK